MAALEETSSDVDLEETYPSVPLAYEYVRLSYDITLKRFDVIEGRLRALLTLAASVTFAVPVLAKATDQAVRLSSPWLLTALATFAIVVALGVGAGTFGSIRLPDLWEIHNKMLHLTDWEFKHRSLYWAADTFDVNSRRLAFKGYVADAMAGFIIIEVCLLAAWALGIS